MMAPHIVDATLAENATARELCRRVLDTAVLECANALGDQPLSIKQLIGRLLIEDFAALNPHATSDWLHANNAENFADGDEELKQARSDRTEAFVYFVLAEFQKSRRA